MSWGPPPPRRPGRPMYRQPNPYWHNPYPSAGFGYYPPPRRSSGVGVVVLVLALILGLPVILLVGGLVLAMVAVAASGPTGPDTSTSTSTSTYAPTATFSSSRTTMPSASSTRPARPTATPVWPTATPTRPTFPTPTSTPPPSPRPPSQGGDSPPWQDPASKDQSVARSRLWQQQPIPRRCAQLQRLTGTSSDLPILQQWLDCAGQVNSRANIAGLSEPSLQLYSGSATSPCGTSPNDGSWAAFYCGANQRIYVDTKVIRRNAQSDWDISSMQILFHEYGHHIQLGAGFLHHASNASDEQASSRVLELQVECFSAISLRQTGNWNEQVWENAWRNGRDSRTHGAARNRLQWMKYGARANSYGNCNTYAVPPGLLQ